MLALALPLLEPRIRHTLGTEDLRGSLTRLVPTLIDLYRHGFIESVPYEESVPQEHEAPDPRSDPGSQHDPPAAGDS